MGEEDAIRLIGKVHNLFPSCTSEQLGALRRHFCKYDATLVEIAIDDYVADFSAVDISRLLMTIRERSASQIDWSAAARKERRESVDELRKIEKVVDPLPEAEWNAKVAEVLARAGDSRPFLARCKDRSSPFLRAIVYRELQRH